MVSAGTPVTLVPGTTITAIFGPGGTISGSDGCNQYSGSYMVSGSQLQVSPTLASTMMACGEPAGVMEQEAQYLAALQSAATYQIEGNVMQLRTKDDALAAIFNRK